MVALLSVLLVVAVVVLVRELLARRRTRVVRQWMEEQTITGRTNRLWAVEDAAVNDALWRQTL